MDLDAEWTVANDAPHEEISKAEFARRVGISKQRVSQLVQAGTLPVAPDGRLSWPEAQRVWLARKAENNDPEQQALEQAPEQAPEQPPAGRRVHPVLSPQRAASSVGEQTDAAVRSSLSYAEARAVEKTIRAQLLNLRLRREKGELVLTDAVQADARAVMAAVRASLLALPGRLSLICEQKSAAEVAAAIEDAVNTLLVEWNQGRFGDQDTRP